MSWLVRLLGRRYNNSVYSDQPVSVRQTYYHTGILQAHVLHPSYLTSITLMRSNWYMHADGADDFGELVPGNGLRLWAIKKFQFC